MTTLYIAGPMTGHPEFNYPAFFDTERLLLRHEYRVGNPASVPQTEGWEWHDYMRATMKILLECDGVALLEGWETSRGATLEHYVAGILKMPIRPLTEWIQLRRSV